MTTYTAFVTALGALSITGVSTRLSEPPAGVVVPPCQWVQLLTGEEGPLTFQANGGWPVLHAQLIVAVEAAAQSTAAQNWTNTLTMLDNVSTALRAAPPLSLCRGVVSWTIRPGIVTVAGTDYWAIVAEVTGNG